MNKDQVKGRATNAKGQIKEAVGKAIGNESLAAEGKIQQIAGKIQANLGDAKNDIKKSL